MRRELPVWGFFGGANAGNGPLLQSVEYDGFITLKDSRDTVRLPWHVLPHRSSDVRVVNRNVVIPNKGFGLMALANSSRALPGVVDVFNLTGTSPQLRPWQLPDEDDETTVHDLAAVGVRATVDNVGLPIVQFAIHTYGRRAHPAYPGGFNVLVDSNNDGKPDFRLFNAEWHGFDSDGVTVIAVDDLSTDADNSNIPVYYYVDADLDSSNLIMSVPPEAIGVRPGVPRSASTWKRATTISRTGRPTGLTRRDSRHGVHARPAEVPRAHRWRRADRRAGARRTDPEGE